MRQVYHPYNTWEGFKSGMYEPCKEGREARVRAAQYLLTDLDALRENMTRVTVEWVNETEHVLSDQSISHRAWLGQSACNIYKGVREDETREAWGKLTEKQRRDANRVADVVDKQWQNKHGGDENTQLSFGDFTGGW